MKAETEKELGNKAYNKRDFTKALSHYEKAFKLDPNNMVYLSNKAGIYLKIHFYIELIKLMLFFELFSCLF